MIDLSNRKKWYRILCWQWFARVSRKFRGEARSVENMRNFLQVFLFSTAANLAALPALAAEPGWSIDQISNAQGKQNILITPHAISITLPKQKYRIYSFAPNWNVIYINDQVGTYLDFPHTQFMGSIMGRLGNQLGNDVQMIPLPKPKMVKENGFDYALYDHNLRATREEMQRMLHSKFPTALYAPRAIKAKYLRLPGVPKEANELACKVSCVPMSSDFPITFTCMDGFKKFLVILTTAQIPQPKSLSITPPNLKGLKRVKTEQELVSRARVSDVFELFDDTERKK
jgi:hypothetical protein